MIIDQFDEMLEQSRKYPLVFSVALHPFIIGQPFRLRAFRDAVRHIMAHRDELWITTPGEIARYCESLPTGDDPTAVSGSAADYLIFPFPPNKQEQEAPVRRRPNSELTEHRPRFVTQ